MATTRGGLSPRRRPAPGRRLLDIQDLHCRRGDGVRAYHVALPDLRLATGEVIALTGASGSGKSTLLEVLGLAAPPARAGRFLWYGGEGALDLVALWQRGTERRLAGLRAARIGFVMQTGGLLPFLTVRENLLINRRLLGMPEEDDHVALIVDSLELGDLLGALPAALSVGQQQRASIGRALAHQPALLLADEPTSALDPRLADRVLSLLLDLARRSGTAVVLATHEQGRVRSLALRRFAAELEPAADDAPPAARFVEPAA
ncbi:ABC transporter ATP-binding protein [uncultured Thiohalocapsa sp.]|uniref:ABC transporter ATP-binding protein n=1 Tax=uncultured Thiohalocapsa sp. TaxID=768990 RepID=UPI0025FCC10B|nr:ATP-binding cassette domain-containing protein [uncultured Thiohalocapsa sp.]